MIVGIHGHGVTTRMYEPVLRRQPAVDVRRIALPHANHAGQLDDDVTAESVAQLRRCALFLVSAPPFAHEAYAALALRAGAAVMCEKPVGLSEDVPARLGDLSADLEVPAFVNYQLRRDPCLNILQQSLDRTDIMAVELSYESGARLALTDMPAWYTNRALGGGVQFSLLSHLIDLIHFVGLRISFVTNSRAWAGAQDKRAFDAIELAGHIVGGGRIRIRCTALSARTRFTLAIRGAQRKWKVDLLQGTVQMSTGSKGSYDLYFRDDNAWRSELGVWRYCFWRCFASLNETGISYAALPTMLDAVSVHEVLNAAESLLAQPGDSWQ